MRRSSHRGQRLATTDLRALSLTADPAQVDGKLLTGMRETLQE